MKKFFSKKNIYKIITFSLPLLLFQIKYAAAFSLSFDPNYSDSSLGSMTEKIHLGANDPLSVSYYIISILLSLLGLAFLILIIYAGFKWMLARGEEEEIEEAKDTIKHGIIGLAIILLSYSIAYLIYTLIGDATVTSQPTGDVTQDFLDAYQ